MNVRLRTQFAALLALAVLASACGKVLPTPASGTVPQAASVSGAMASQKAGAGKLTVSPTKLDFTTKDKLTLTIGENGYKGAFRIDDGAASVVKVSKTSAKGPGPVKITVTAKAAGSGKIVVTDTKRGKATISVSVTTAVVIVH